MKFSLILWVLARKLKSRIKKDPAFKEHIKEKNFTLVMKTADGSRGRSFKFSNGEVISEAGVVEGNVSFVWCDAATAAATMTSKDPNANMNALKEGKLKLEGDGALALWFVGTAKKLKEPIQK